LKINFACGKQTWDGFYCIDAARNQRAKREPDLYYAMEFDGVNLRAEIPLPDECATELHSYHFIEHVYRWEAPAVLAEWRRLLKRGGLLDDQMSMWPIYGDWGHCDPYMMHKHGYTPITISALLAANGFDLIKVLPPRTHCARSDRDMRVEARKA
jgi:hypothetical protein